MPSAAGKIVPPASADTACGSAARMASVGSDQPITPVELGNTAVGVSPSNRAASTQTRSAVSTPPGAHTLEILLLMMMAPSAGALRRLRPTVIGAPGNAFLVNAAAKSGVGRSSAISVSVIFAGFGASRGTKSNRVVPTRKPAGSAAWVASHARCESRLGNVRLVLGTTKKCWAPARRARNFLWKCARHVP